MLEAAPARSEGAGAAASMCTCARSGSSAAVRAGMPGACGRCRACGKHGRPRRPARSDPPTLPTRPWKTGAMAAGFPQAPTDHALNDRVEGLSNAGSSAVLEPVEAVDGASKSPVTAAVHRSHRLAARGSRAAERLTGPADSGRVASHVRPHVGVRRVGGPGARRARPGPRARQCRACPAVAAARPAEPHSRPAVARSGEALGCGSTLFDGSRSAGASPAPRASG